MGTAESCIQELQVFLRENLERLPADASSVVIQARRAELRKVQDRIENCLRRGQPAEVIRPHPKVGLLHEAARRVRWTRRELEDAWEHSMLGNIAQSFGLSGGGSKEELIQRILKAQG